MLVVTGGGAALAAIAKNSVGSPQIINGSIKGKDVKDDKLTGKDIKESSLAIPAAAQVKNGAGPAQRRPQRNRARRLGDRLRSPQPPPASHW